MAADYSSMAANGALAVGQKMQGLWSTNQYRMIPSLHYYLLLLS
jgi:hypothetical protein